MGDGWPHAGIKRIHHCLQRGYDDFASVSDGISRGEGHCASVDSVTSRIALQRPGGATPVSANGQVSLGFRIPP